MSKSENNYRFYSAMGEREHANTGGLGSMTLIRFDAKNQVHKYLDNTTKAIWVSEKGKKYGHLTPFPVQLPDIPPSATTITLPDGSQHRTLYIMDPVKHRYEPLGAGPSPAQAHVTEKHGRIVLTTCPLLLRIHRGISLRRHADVEHHRNKWHPSAMQTMTLFDHDTDQDVYLWRDNVIGGIWKTVPGWKYGRLSHWEGQPENQPWKIPVPKEELLGIPSFPAVLRPGIRDFEEMPMLFLMDPVRHSVYDNSNDFQGWTTSLPSVGVTRQAKVGARVVDRRTGRMERCLAKHLIRMVDKGAMDEERRAGMPTQQEFLYETYEGCYYEDGQDEETSGEESETPSVWDSDRE